MKELNQRQIENVSGGAGPAAVLAGLMAFGGYMNAIGGFSSFGRGLGIGLYNGLHRLR